MNITETENITSTNICELQGYVLCFSVCVWMLDNEQQNSQATEGCDYWEEYLEYNDLEKYKHRCIGIYSCWETTHQSHQEKPN